jgi:hypothetical protein
MKKLSQDMYGISEIIKLNYRPKQKEKLLTDSLIDLIDQYIDCLDRIEDAAKNGKTSVVYIPKGVFTDGVFLPVFIHNNLIRQLKYNRFKIISKNSSGNFIIGDLGFYTSIEISWKPSLYERIVKWIVK